MLAPSQPEGFTGAECRIDELRMAGHWRYARARPNTLKAHLHRRAFEICFVAEGQADWWVEDSRYLVKRGQFYITKPEELHGAAESSAMPDELYWVQVAFPQSSPAAGMSLQETRMLESRFWSLQHRVFDATFDCTSLYERILASLREPTDLSLIALRGALALLLAGVLGDADQNTFRSPQTAISPRIRLALEHIDAHLADDVTIEQIAAAAGLAPSQFHKLFARQIGLSPGSYLSRRRIERAKRLLTQANASVSEIAFDLGFSSSQYFATVFKSLTGMVPRQYRAWSRQEDPLARPAAAYVD